MPSINPLALGITQLFSKILSPNTTASGSFLQYPVSKKPQCLLILINPYSLNFINPLTPIISAVTYHTTSSKIITKSVTPAFKLTKLIQKAIPFPAVFPYLPTYLNGPNFHVAPSSIPNGNIVDDTILGTKLFPFFLMKVALFVLINQELLLFHMITGIR
jgi:hypothetical protein